jgi:SRSO17 transposase
MAEDIEARFERYCDVMVSPLAHADRREPGCWYRKGLMLPGGRKSIEPMTGCIHRMCARRTSRCITCGPTRNGCLHVREARQFPGQPLLMRSSPTGVRPHGAPCTGTVFRFPPKDYPA